VDNVTHTAIGFALAAAGGYRVRSAETAALVLGSNLPDADAVLLFAGREPFILYHRSFTHAALGVPVLAALLALLLRAFTRRAGFGALFSLAAVGVAGHVVADLFTSWGTMLLFPFSWRRFSLDWVFIVDLFYLGILAVPLGAAAARLVPPGRAGRAALALLAAYIAFCGLEHHRAIAATRAVFPSGAEDAQAFPQPLSPFRWLGIATDRARGAVWAAFLDLRQGQPAETLGPFRAAPPHEAVDYAPLARWLWWARAPIIASVDGPVTTYADLRFLSRLRPGLSFQLDVEAGPDGRPRAHAWHGGPLRALEAPR
jgi:inner membrane protein